MIAKEAENESLSKIKTREDLFVKKNPKIIQKNQKKP